MANFLKATQRKQTYCISTHTLFQSDYSDYSDYSDILIIPIILNIPTIPIAITSILLPITNYQQMTAN